MNSSDQASGGGERTALCDTIEMVANLVYMAKRSKNDPQRLHSYLEEASRILLEMHRYPQLHEIRRTETSYN